MGEYALMKNGIYDAASAKRVADVLRHEHGHALDRLIGASESPAFVAAYTADVADLVPWLTRLPADAADELKYLTQSGPAGRHEAFAELFAELHGGGTTTFLNVSGGMPRSLTATRAIIRAWERERP